MSLLKEKPIRSFLSKRPTLVLSKPLVVLLGIDPPLELPPGVTPEQAVEVVAGSAWARGWASGIAKLAGYTPGTPEFTKQVERLSKFVARRMLGLE